MIGRPATGSPGISIVAVLRPEDPAADSSVVIQQAVDRAASSGGAVVCLPEGRLNLSRPLILRDNVELRGIGAATVLKASADFLRFQGPYGGHPLITTDGAANVTIRDLTADHSGDVLDGNSTGGRLNEYLIDVRHSVNVKVEGVRTRNPFTYSIAVVGSHSFCIQHNDTTVATSGKYDQLDGIHVLDSHDGLVAANQVDQGAGSDGDDGLVAHTMGGTVYDVTYKGNTVRGGRHGAAMQLALGDGGIHDITVVGNRFWGSPVGVHTGYYEGDGPVGRILVRGNTFVDIPGCSVDIFGRLSEITVTDNVRYRSGAIRVSAGKENRISGNALRS